MAHSQYRPIFVILITMVFKVTLDSDCQQSEDDNPQNDLNTQFMRIYYLTRFCQVSILQASI